MYHSQVNRQAIMSLIQNYIDGLSDCLKELLQQNVAEIADIISVGLALNSAIIGGAETDG